jgi:hypothetical protein
LGVGADDPQRQRIVEHPGVVEELMSRATDRNTPGGRARFLVLHDLARAFG